jgi:hypothetical protein
MMASMTELTGRDVLGMRLANLRLSVPGDSPAGLVDWFGAMQAQDLASGKWSLGVRLPGSSEVGIDAALASGEVIRTWPMRGTIHLIHPKNARWMLELTGSRALMGLQKRWDYLGLDKETLDRAADVLGDALRGGKRLTRDQCLDVLSDAGIDTGPGRSYHLLWHTAQIGVTCIGPNEGKEQTFVLLDDWAPEQRRPDRQEALALLAQMYFRSHGPTTRADFQGWTGLTAKDARTGIDQADLQRATWAGREVFYVDSERPEPPKALLLPGFDEYLLGYKDRGLFLHPADSDKIVPGGNGMFKATVVESGTVVGTWHRKPLSKTLRVTISAFAPLTKTTRRAIETRAHEYASYAGRALDLRFD